MLKVKAIYNLKNQKVRDSLFVEDVEKLRRLGYHCLLSENHERLIVSRPVKYLRSDKNVAKQMCGVRGQLGSG